MTVPENATRAFLGDEALWSAASIELHDVQGLWGGRRITAEGAGRLAVQIVKPEGLETRYELALGHAAWRRLLDACVENDFLTVKPAERPGIPDEARPRITLVNAAGHRRTAAKWAGVEDRRFDTIYTALSQLESLTKGVAPTSRGPHQYGD